MHVATVAAQPAYVAPGGIAIGAGAGPVYLTPGVPINRAAAHVGPGYDYGYRGVADYDLPYDHRYGRRPAPPEYGPGRRYGYGDRPGPRDYGYGPPPHSDYGYGPGRRYGYGYGPGPRDYEYNPPPRIDYGYGPGRRYSYGYGPRHQYDGPLPRSEPPPRSDYGFGPPPRHSYGDGPGPRYDYRYGPGPRDYGYGSPPRYRGPARTSAHTPKADAANPQPLPHMPAPFAGQQ